MNETVDCTATHTDRQRRRAEALTIPSPGDVAACLEVADERLRAFVAVCALAGLRLSGTAGLKFSDVDYARKQLHVHRQVQMAGRKDVEIRLPKYGSERSVPMPEELAVILMGPNNLGGIGADLSVQRHPQVNVIFRRHGHVGARALCPSPPRTPSA
jgi:integrase